MIDEEAREELQGLGVRSTPATKIGDEVVLGFDKAKLNELLNL